MNKPCVLYDGDCPMCTGQMKMLRRLDWFHAVELIPLADPRVREIAPQLRPEDLLRAIHCVTPAGRVYQGARAFRYLGMRVPLLFPLALAMWLPGIIYPAEFIYRRVSRHRHWLSRVFGCADSCALRPARQPEPDKPA